MRGEQGRTQPALVPAGRQATATWAVNQGIDGTIGVRHVQRLARHERGKDGGARERCGFGWDGRERRRARLTRLVTAVRAVVVLVGRALLEID